MIDPALGKWERQDMGTTSERHLFHGRVYTVAPVAYQVILEPGIDQFREFEPRRVHSRINSLGLFLVHKLTCGNARERELATLDEKIDEQWDC